MPAIHLEARGRRRARRSDLLPMLFVVFFGACNVPTFSFNTDNLATPDAGSDAGATNDAGADVCIGNDCALSCPDGFADCNGQREDGCETPLDSASDCGTCDVPCENSHGLTSCQRSDTNRWSCAPICASGFADCDLNPSNGCETDINSDSTHCGSCDFACPGNGGTPLCQAGRCGVSSCNTGFGDCSNEGVCNVRLNSDPANCGQCGHVCSNAHGTSSCNAGHCEIACETGFDDCNALATGASPPPDDGCETKLNVPDSNGNIPNCGACASACDRRAYTTVNVQQCTLGVCSRDCFANQGDCDNNRNSPGCTGSGCGCEQSLVSNVNSCGACGHVCKGGGCANNKCDCPDTEPKSGTVCTLASTVKCGPYGTSCSCTCTSGAFKCTDSSGRAC